MADPTHVTDEEWEEYKKKFDKSYDGEEDQKRRRIYAESKKRVAEHNKKYEAKEVSFSLGINQFSDKEPHEVAKGRLPAAPH